MPRLLKKENQAEMQSILDMGADTDQGRFLKELVEAVTKLLASVQPKA